MKSKSSQQKAPAQQLSTLHKTCAGISKHESERSLHELAASALDKVMKSGGKLSEVKLTIGLEKLSSGLLDRVVELEKREAEVGRIQRKIWDERFCDYVSKCLAKVKSTTAWKSWLYKYQKWAWVAERLEGHDYSVDQVLKEVSLETKWDVKAIESWIRLYSQRCDIHHHRGFDDLIREGKLTEIGNRILEDKELLWETTPPEIRTTIPHVFVAISDLEQTFFKKLTPSNFTFSKAGEKIKKRGAIDKFLFG
jgi:hypothetical protein